MILEEKNDTVFTYLGEGFCLDHLPNFPNGLTGDVVVCRYYCLNCSDWCVSDFCIHDQKGMARVLYVMTELDDASSRVSKGAYDNKK